jgi:hypothetical protein
MISAVGGRLPQSINSGLKRPIQSFTKAKIQIACVIAATLRDLCNSITRSSCRGTAQLIPKQADL